MTRRVALAGMICAAGACGPPGGEPDARHVDANRADAPGPVIDASTTDAGPPDAAPPDAGTEPYRHTITIDGVNDFAAGDTFTTTSAAYATYVTWDATTLYFGFAGPDVDPAALDTGFKWIFVHLDVDPGAATGEPHSLTYNTQRATFPTGFGSEYYYRWKCDATFATLEQSDGLGTWTTISVSIPAAHAGDFLELAIPLTELGSPAALGIEIWMINEKPLVESTFAGLYSDNFTDGYYPDLALTAYLRADFASPNAPNDPANHRP